MTLRSFALRRGALLTLTFAMAAALAACGTGSSGGDAGAGDPSVAASADAGGGSTATVEGGTVEISADNLAFDAETIQAPAGESFTIVLTNLEAVPHNLSVYTEEGGDEIVIGDVVSEEGGSVEVEVPALEPGEYFFVCDIHPTEMTGTLVVEG